MKRFRNILVGIDLSEGDRLVGDALLAPSEQAIQQAVWVATQSGARVTFMYSLDVCVRAQHLLLEAEGEHTVLDEARHALQKVVRQAADRGVDASFEIGFEKTWVELIRQVLKSQHDLVVVGTSGHSAVSQVLFGSTGMKLLRKCPCPVWVTKPSDQQQIASVLVAHDLTPVGGLALELGASLSELHHSKLHVVHAIERAEYETSPQSGILAETIADRSAAAQSQIEAQLQGYKLALPPRITVTDVEPSEAILKYIDAHRIELLAMGTIARTGVSGVITGNTAERLLPRIPCSILAVKPADFVSPVKLSP